MIEASDMFAVLAHVDYPVREWPAAAGPYDPGAFEEEYREVLRALAGTSRALEVNTTVPLHPRIVRWWHEAGGDAIAFGSDAHDPGALARGFSDVAAMVEAHGFRPSRDPHDIWAPAREPHPVTGQGNRSEPIIGSSLVPDLGPGALACEGTGTGSRQRHVVVW